MHDDVIKRARELHNAYLPFRVTGVPFPPASVAWFCFLLALQERLGIRGDMLELGVQHGGTAFLTIAALAPDERQVLIDLRRTREFAAKFDALPEAVRQRVVFFEMAGHAARPRVGETIAAARFVHIDGGHMKADVEADFADYGPLVSPDGILCFDDVFEIKWPGVTEAVIAVLPGSPFAPLALVDRKLYCCRRDRHAGLAVALSEALPALETFGRVRHWTEQFLETPTLIVRQTPDPAVARAAL